MTALVVDRHIVVEGRVNAARTQAVRNGKQNQHPIVRSNGKAEQCQRRQRHGNRSDLARTKTQGHTIGKQRGNNGASGNRHGNAASPRNGSTQIDTHRRPCGTQYRIRQAKADERHINHRKQKINHALLLLDR